MDKNLTTTADAVIAAVSGAAQLKLDFAQGSVPSSEHFAALIDLANLGPKTLGLTNDTGIENPTTPGLGLTIDASKKLTVRLSDISGISSDAINGLVINRGAGLIKIGPEITVGAGDGISTADNKVTVARSANSALTAVGGLSVNRGGGLVKSGDDIAIGKGAGILVNANDITVNLGVGLKIVSDKITCEVTRENIFTAGMIMMFSGNTAPNGWAFCDGETPGVPNLIDRFIIGKGPGAPVGSTTAPMAGGANNKSFTVTTSSVAVAGTVTVDNTTLTENNIPRHRHYSGPGYGNQSDAGHGANINLAALHGLELLGYNQGHVVPEGNYLIGWKKPNVSVSQFWTSWSGAQSPAGHTHGARATLGPHTHTVSIAPPYYALAFIMKI